MTSVLDIIWDLFRKPEPPVMVSDMPEISSDEVRKLLEPFGGQLWISDGKFKLMDTENLKEFLSMNTVKSRKYITEFHDCDDFCIELMGDVSTWNPSGSFGMIWGNRADGVGHAWNFFINENKKVIFIEPQNDVIFTPTSEKSWVMIV